MSDVEPVTTSAEAEVSVRRAPKVPVFLVLGALLGFFVTLILTGLFPTDPTVGFPATFGYFLLYGVPAGVVLGALIALVLDRVSVHRAKNIMVEHTTVDPLPYEDDEPVEG
jgi:hypothetical protein